MLPLTDVNPTRRTPYVTYALIAINVVVFLSQLTLSPRELQFTFLNDAIVPLLVTRDPFSVETLLDFVRSMFFHGGWLHLLSNMLYLWIFGDNIEDRLGKLLYLVLYFASGFAAGFAQVAISPESRIPLVGASGAIAGVLGAYALMFPNATVRGLIVFGFVADIIELPAMLVLGFWFVTQLFSGVASLGVDTMTGGVAFFAHIGGFVAGLALTWVFMQIVPQPPIDQRREWLYRRYGRPYDDF
jgi:membrane associated rhomboid family serine protease